MRTELKFESGQLIALPLALHGCVWLVCDLQERVWGRKAGLLMTLRLESELIGGFIWCFHCFPIPLLEDDCSGVDNVSGGWKLPKIFPVPFKTKWVSLEIEGLARQLPTAESNSYLTVIWLVKLLGFLRLTVRLLSNSHSLQDPQPSKFVESPGHSISL